MAPLAFCEYVSLCLLHLLRAAARTRYGALDRRGSGSARPGVPRQREPAAPGSIWEAVGVGEVGLSPQQTPPITTPAAFLWRSLSLLARPSRPARAHV
jgi:hypothetical protein